MPCLGVGGDSMRQDAPPSGRRGSILRRGAGTKRCLVFHDRARADDSDYDAGLLSFVRSLAVAVTSGQARLLYEPGLAAAASFMPTCIACGSRGTLKRSQARPRSQGPRCDAEGDGRGDCVARHCAGRLPQAR